MGSPPGRTETFQRFHYWPLVSIESKEKVGTKIGEIQNKAEGVKREKEDGRESKSRFGLRCWSTNAYWVL